AVSPALERPATPRTPPVHREPELRALNDGELTFRVPRRRLGLPFVGGLGGYLVGAKLIALAWVSAPAFALAGTGLAAGRLLAGKPYECSDPECREPMATELPRCPRCGGTIAETIADPALRLERREQLRGGGS